METETGTTMHVPKDRRTTYQLDAYANRGEQLHVFLTPNMSAY